MGSWSRVVVFHYSGLCKASSYEMTLRPCRKEEKQRENSDKNNNW